MARLILVSNRVPVPAGEGQRPRRRARGRLALGVQAPSRRVVRMERERRAKCGSGNGDDRASDSSYVLTDLSEEDYQEFYNGFANRVLWPILHYRLDLAEFTRRDLTGYMRVNAPFCQRAVEAHST